MSARVLVVGAGAVGQVYGSYLTAGGMEVGVLVKPHYARTARAGFQLIPARGDPYDWVPSVVLDAPVEAALSRWDQVWLCVSSPALRGPWLDELISATPDAVVVAMGPGMHDRERLLGLLPEERLISGLIGFSAWQAPLPGQTGPSGLGYWFPPLMKSRFSGAEAPTEQIVDTLKRGGMPVGLSDSAEREGAIGSAVLLPTMASLEIAGWTFSAWRRDPIAAVGVAACKEALSIAGAIHGVPVWHLQALLGPRRMARVMAVAETSCPVSLETFFRVHFTKVGDQTREGLSAWIEAGRAHGLPTANLAQLSARLPKA